MKEIIKDSGQVAYCGLYCGACPRYLKEKCPGCHKNEKAGWCKVRKCCIENGKMSCADCQVYTNASECRKFNNIFSKLFSFIFGSDRQASIDLIKKAGYDGYAKEMTDRRMQSIKKK